MHDPLPFVLAQQVHGCQEHRTHHFLSCVILPQRCLVTKGFEEVGAVCEVEIEHGKIAVVGA